MGAAVAHDVGMRGAVLVAGQVGQVEQLLRILLEQIHPAGNGSETHKINISMTSTSRISKFLPLANADVHVLLLARVDVLAVLQVVQGVKHAVVHLVDLPGYVIPHAGLVQQEGYVVAGGDNQRQLLGGGGLAPELGVSVPTAGQDRVAGLAVLESAVDEQLAQGGGGFLYVWVGGCGGGRERSGVRLEISKRTQTGGIYGRPICLNYRRSEYFPLRRAP